MHSARATGNTKVKRIQIVESKQIIKQVTNVPVKLKKEEIISLEKRFEFGAISIWACGFCVNFLDQ